VRDYNVHVLAVIGQGGDLIEIGNLAYVPGDDDVCRVAMVVADLIDPPIALAGYYPVALQRCCQHSFFKRQELINIETMKLQSSLFRFLVFAVQTSKQVEGFFEGVEVPADEITNHHCAVFITEWRS
jgi:hypothetical protein